MPLIVGLGNPGKEYEGTPHNVGFDVLVRLAERSGVAFRRSRSGDAEEAVVPASPKVVLLRPLSFMNLSGRPVSAALRWHGFQISELLVVCDDVNLPLGHIRIREKGGAGGQKGLLSVIQHLGTDEVSRLRIGVGGGHPGANVAHHVLSKFSRAEREIIESALDLSADAVECYLKEGLGTAMNLYNTKRPAQKDVNPSGGKSSPDETSPQGEV
ncbi:MAG TPA: aminoacyl-tRNA hydrolase [bacterium]|jgi:PTH1 family peptidyl-tRNA hydrolase